MEGDPCRKNLSYVLELWDESSDCCKAFLVVFTSRPVCQIPLAFPDIKCLNESVRLLLKDEWGK